MRATAAELTPIARSDRRRGRPRIVGASGPVNERGSDGTGGSGVRPRSRRRSAISTFVVRPRTPEKGLGAVARRLQRQGAGQGLAASRDPRRPGGAVGGARAARRRRDRRALRAPGAHDATGQVLPRPTARPVRLRPPRRGDEARHRGGGEGVRELRRHRRRPRIGRPAEQEAGTLQPALARAVRPRRDRRTERRDPRRVAEPARLPAVDRGGRDDHRGPAARAGPRGARRAPVRPARSRSAQGAGTPATGQPR